MTAVTKYDVYTRMVAGHNGMVFGLFNSCNYIMGVMGGGQSSFQDALNDLENPSPIKNEETYQDYLTISRRLCSVSCTTSNHDLPENDQVWALEGEYNRLIHVWTKKTRIIKDPLLKAVCKLMSWDRYMPWYNTQQVWGKLADFALANKALYQDEQKNLVVAGFNVKIGDNIFSIDSRGRDHRKYVSTVAPQAFNVNNTAMTALSESEWRRDKIIPVLPSEYVVTWQGDGKGCAKNHRMSDKERALIDQFLRM